MLKPACFWCGSRTSTIARSDHQVTSGEGYRRRRRCTDCGRTFPTIELPDVERFKRELARLGIDPATLGL